MIWRYVLLALVVALGVQSYRLQGAQAERDLLALEKQERLARDQRAALAAMKNKERTDEEYAAARRRATAVVVRSGNAAGGIRRYTPPAPPGRDDATVCFSRDVLEREIASLAERMAGRATDLARAGEDLGAAYRACRAFVRDAQ